MAILNFTLNPEALGKLHDALVCLGKFSEAVSIEAHHDKVRQSHSNSQKVWGLIQMLASFDSAQLLEVSIRIIYSGREQVLLQVSVQGPQIRQPGERKIQL